ncbi:hypothetical protein [Campylobacter sp. 19-13652]|uniref:hypothetical protein n=1 Tax=Campylobacter sp. 19-13652 TaxID=2840180 RepID=UPI001C78544A|nr:hypothetical protein [Campylobacter sp. 19-13652]BCX79407.1 hypothetical protein LBC_08690 [Campylobacter sp. 19-13652]
MSVSPLGNINFINQNSPVVSHSASTQQARFDMQAAMASEISAQKEREVEEVRPAEEAYKIDPEHEHERGGSGAEYDEQHEGFEAKDGAQEQDDDKLGADGEGFYHLDIKI